MSGIRYDSQQVAFNARFWAQQSNSKPGVTAMTRRLLLLCYSLQKNDQLYEPHYHSAQ